MDAPGPAHLLAGKFYEAGEMRTSRDEPAIVRVAGLGRHQEASPTYVAKVARS